MDAPAVTAPLPGPLPTTLYAPPPTGPAADLPAPPTGSVAGDRWRLVRLLVLVEVVVAVISLMESTVVAAVGLGAATAPLLTAVVVAALVWCARAAGRGLGRVPLLVVHVLFLASAAVDLVITLLEQVPPLPVPLLVRIALPATVLALLCRPA